MEDLESLGLRLVLQLLSDFARDKFEQVSSDGHQQGAGLRLADPMSDGRGQNRGSYVRCLVGVGRGGRTVRSNATWVIDHMGTPPPKKDMSENITFP